MQQELISYPNLSVLEGKVADVIVQDNIPDGEGDGHKGRITGVRLESGEIIPTNHVVITTGTFLGGEIHIGWSIYTLLIHSFPTDHHKASTCFHLDVWERRRHSA